MNEPLSLVSALLAGGVLGGVFFGGLWWTVRWGLSSKRVALWFLGSMLLRTSMALLSFYLILGDSWKGLLTGLLGFVIARTIVTRLTREAAQRGPWAQEAGHAP